FSAAATDLLSGSFEVFIQDSPYIVPNAPFTLTQLEVTFTGAVAVPGPTVGGGLPGSLLLVMTGLILCWRHLRNLQRPWDTFRVAAAFVKESGTSVSSRS